VNQAIRLRLSQARGEFAPLAAHLAQLSPLKILDRGYAIVERGGKIVKTPADAPVGSDVRLRLAAGELAAKIVSAPNKRE
jgi:exodeoxyribonuclease VII large subunit